MNRIERAMNAPHAVSATFDLMQKLGAPTSLQQIGMRRDDLARAASLVMESPYHNPQPLTYDGVLSLLDDAFVGRCRLPDRLELQEVQQAG